MIEELYSIERLALEKSIIHDLDSRVKIIVSFAAIIAMVAYPYTWDVWIPGGLFFAFFIIAWILSGLSFMTYLKRVFLILPFGIFIILFQIFFENRHYDVFTPVVDLPLGIHIYAESMEFAAILLVKFIVCISFIILLSSTTTMQDMLKGSRRLGLPSEFALIIGLMIRYLFVFAEIFGKVNNVFETRCFNAFDRRLPHKYRLRILSFAIGTLFIRSYEQGERTYISMLCRGYSKDSFLNVSKKSLKRNDLLFLATAMVYIIAIPVYAYFIL